MSSFIKILHIPAILIWLIGLFGIINQLYGFATFLSSWANAIISPTYSSTLAFFIHGLMVVIGIGTHFVIEKVS